MTQTQDNLWVTVDPAIEKPSVNWRHKAAIQKLMGRLPPTLGNRIYYELQCRFGGLRHPNPVGRLKAGIEMVRRIRQFEGTVESAAFLEIGTGHQLALPLSMWLCGAAEVMTVDLNCYLKERLVMNDVEYLRSHEEEVRDLFADVSPPRLFNERFERLLAGAKNLAGLLSLTNIRYRAPADATRLPLEANSIDYHVSFTVLEHIPAGVLKKIVQEGCRLLRPSGLFIHHIDFTDHFAHSDDTISSVNFCSSRTRVGLAGGKPIHVSQPLAA